jgi:hypothetical protein
MLFETTQFLSVPKDTRSSRVAGAFLPGARRAGARRLRVHADAPKRDPSLLLGLQPRKKEDEKPH